MGLWLGGCDPFWQICLAVRSFYVRTAFKHYKYHILVFCIPISERAGCGITGLQHLQLMSRVHSGDNASYVLAGTVITIAKHDLHLLEQRFVPITVMSHYDGTVCCPVALFMRGAAPCVRMARRAAAPSAARRCLGRRCPGF